MRFQKIYDEVVTGKRYDGDAAEKHNIEMYMAEVKAGNLPEIEAKFVKENNCGCCLHFSMYLLYLLKQEGIKCYLTTTLEDDNANHCSVLYFDESGEYFIADPVEDIKNGTQRNHMAIDYDEFVKNAIGNKIAHYDVFGEKYKDELFFEAPFLEDCKIKLSTMLET